VHIVSYVVVTPTLANNTHLSGSEGSTAMEMFRSGSTSPLLINYQYVGSHLVEPISYHLRSYLVGPKGTHEHKHTHTRRLKGY